MAKWNVQPIERAAAGINQVLPARFSCRLQAGVATIVDNAGGAEICKISLAGKHYKVEVPPCAALPQTRFDYYRADSITPVVRGIVSYLPHNLV